MRLGMGNKLGHKMCTIPAHILGAFANCLNYIKGVQSDHPADGFGFWCSERSNHVYSVES